MKVNFSALLFTNVSMLIIRYYEHRTIHLEHSKLQESYSVLALSLNGLCHQFKIA
jgi:hypothetical protein